MVIDQHFLGGGGQDVILQVFGPGKPVEVEAEKDVGRGYQAAGFLGIALADEDRRLFGVEECEALGMRAGQDDTRPFSAGFQVMPGGGDAAHGVSVGVEMPDEHDVAGIGQQGFELSGIDRHRWQISFFFKKK